MKKTLLACVLLGLSVLVLTGCKTGYTWRPGVPADMRTVAVPTFRNESNLTELGSVMTTQLLREFQREGTFKIRPTGDSALEIQGVVKSVKRSLGAYSRRSDLRQSSSSATAKVEISVIDKRTRKVLVDNRKYVAQATFTSGEDLSTGLRDAAGRLGEDLARQVVDDVLNMKW